MLANAVYVVIPALNEAGNIGRLVQEVQACLPVQVIVVDNGSSDSTALEAASSGARVISEARRGYGYACAAGVAAIPAADAVVFLDGDYSFLPSEMPALLQPILENEADLCLGSRVLGGIMPDAMPPHQRFGNWLIANLVNRLYGVRVTDLGPYRAIRFSLLKAVEMREMTYGWPTEMIIKAARRAARIVEVPVSYHSRQAGRSKVSGTLRGSVLAAWFIFGVTFRYAWRPRSRRA